MNRERNGIPGPRGLGFEPGRGLRQDCNPRGRERDATNGLRKWATVRHSSVASVVLRVNSASRPVDTGSGLAASPISAGGPRR